MSQYLSASSTQSSTHSPIQPPHLTQGSAAHAAVLANGMTRLTTQAAHAVLWFAFVVWLGCAVLYGSLAQAQNPTLSFDNISKDYDAFYDKDRLLRLGGAFAVMSLFANTSADQQIQDWYAQNVESHRTNKLSFYAKQFGEKKYAVPAALALSQYQHFQKNDAVGQFGANTARAYVVGTPAMLLMQKVTGASRPVEQHRYQNKDASKWRFLHDNNGVSGHSFMGAVPFLTIAKMNEDNDAIKVAALLASTLTAWSRVNDGSHYFSQAVLGWYMAYESVDAVFEVNERGEQKDKMLFRIGITREW